MSRPVETLEEFIERNRNPNPPSDEQVAAVAAVLRNAAARQAREAAANEAQAS